MRMGTPKKGAYAKAETASEKKKHRFGRSGGKTMLKQSSLDRYTPYPPQSDAQARIDMITMQQLIFSGASFRSIDSKVFEGSLMQMDTRARTKSSQWCRTIGLDRFWRECKRHIDLQLAEDLPSCPGVCFTCDMWKAGNGVMYCALTLHYIDAKMHVRQFAIEFHVWTEQETAVEICNFLQTSIKAIADNNYKNTHLPEPEPGADAEVTVVEDVFPPPLPPQTKFKFPNKETKISIVTDNAANMLAGVKLAKKTFANPDAVINNSYGCVCHLLQLCLKSAFEKIESTAGTKRPRVTTAEPTPNLVINAVNRAKTFAQKLNKSTPACDIMRAEAAACGGIK